jgi:hypothetical protein
MSTPATALFNEFAFLLCKYGDVLTIPELWLFYYPPYILTVSLVTLLCPTQNQHKDRNRQNLPYPRPQNPWIIFRKNFASRLRAKCPFGSYKVCDISKLAGEEWKNQSDDVKRYFGVLSKLARELHRDTFPDYVYLPKKTRQSRKKNKALSFRNTDIYTFMRKNTKESVHRAAEDDDKPTPIQNEDLFYEVDVNHEDANAFYVNEYLGWCESVNDYETMYSQEVEVEIAPPDVTNSNFQICNESTCSCTNVNSMAVLDNGHNSASVHHHVTQTVDPSLCFPRNHPPDVSGMSAFFFPHKMT